MARYSKFGSRALERIAQAAERAPMHPPLNPAVGDFFPEGDRVWLYTSEGWMVVERPSPTDWVSIKAQEWERVTQDMARIAASLGRALNRGLRTELAVAVTPDMAKDGYRCTMRNSYSKVMLKFDIHDADLAARSTSPEAFGDWITTVCAELRAIWVTNAKNGDLSQKFWGSALGATVRPELIAEREAFFERLRALGVRVDTEGMNLERETQEAIASIKQSLGLEQ